MKERYIELMETALKAYSIEKIYSLVREIKENGITEHGFPRLTANIGILIAHGRRFDLSDIFIEMMDICCEEIPNCKNHIANDFSVKELVFAIMEIEKTDHVKSEKVHLWKDQLSKLDPWKDYDCIAPAENVRVGNWAAYNAASEYMRNILCECNSEDFLNRQIPSQLLSFDENGMYRDPDEPMLYDLATRSQFAVLLHFGYKGKFRNEIDLFLKKAGPLTLKMQSPTGEIPFGGRSNQFLFNEAYLAAICEFEASRYLKEGDIQIAGQFKDAAALASDSIFNWIDLTEGKKHVKNKFPTDSDFGCEDYGYFDKYMISLASFIYLAWLFADDSIEPKSCPAKLGGYTAQTSSYFHKFFANHKGYFLEWDTNADTNYDATGLGRIHYADAPSALILSVPFAKEPHYSIGKNNTDNMAFGLNNDPIKSITALEETPEYLKILTEHDKSTEIFELSDKGIMISISGNEQILYNIPIFQFDGTEETKTENSENEISVVYRNWKYDLKTDGNIINTNIQYRNRNGYYNLFQIKKSESLTVNLSVSKL